MPVAIRLSKNFYDRFGDDAAGELVNVLNTVDLAYRSELKEVNAHNFALFDAKLEQRFAESNARMEALFATRDVKLEQRFADIDRRFTESDARWAQGRAESDAHWEKQFADIRVEMATRETHIVRWMFVFWSTNFLALVGLGITVLRAR
jgi:hypothetical protein